MRTAMHMRRSTFRCLRGPSIAVALLGLCAAHAAAPGSLFAAQANNVITVQAAVVTGIQGDVGGSAAGSFSQGLQDGAPCYTVLTSSNVMAVASQAELTRLLADDRTWAGILNGTGPQFASARYVLLIAVGQIGSGLVINGRLLEADTLRLVAAGQRLPARADALADAARDLGSELASMLPRCVEDMLFINPFYATGYPITEAYWASVMVGGTERDVLWQCFERRCLTYTPGNPEGFLVEAGNVGQHYYRWRHGDAQPQTENVNIHLVAIGDAGQSGMLIGCDDSLIPVQREIEATDDVELKITRTLEILLGLDDEFYGESGLYNALYQSDLSVESVTVVDGVATVNLTGDLLIGGVCDEPRVEEQLAQAVLQFEGVNEAVITLNGGPLFEPQGPDTETVNIFLVELADGEEPNGEGTFGCGDTLVPVEVEIAAQEDTAGRIAAALNALFAYEDDELYNVFAGMDLTVSDVQLINGVATVNVSGVFGVGGICDEPRVIEQVNATVMQFDGVERVVLLVNGATPFPSQQLGAN